MISVVITVRNRPGYLRECAQALAEQSVPAASFETVIVDDASDDDGRTRQAIDDIQARHRGLVFKTLRLRKRHGPGAARNKGNSLAAGNLIVVQDSDDISLPTRLWRIQDFFNRNPGVDVFFSGGYRCDSGLGARRQQRASMQMVDWLERHQDIWHPTMAYRRAVWEKVKYPADLADVDYGFLLDAKRAGFRFGCLDEPLVLYREHPDQISRANYKLQQQLAQEKRRG